ncbi:MAG: HIT family protein [Nitrospirae bacterium]|nr:MAG: HIT family protein [Nitrospirota bacterium]
MFTLHERLRADTFDITRLYLSRVLLMNDSSLPWLILVPERENIREIYELDEKDRAGLIEEITLASRIIQHLYKPDKINVGALGNLVPQLHIHIIGRFGSDRAWPGPIWGAGPAEPYGDDERDATRARIERAFMNYLSSRCRC